MSSRAAVENKSSRRESGASMDGGQKGFDTKVIVFDMKQAACAVREKLLDLLGVYWWYKSMSTSRIPFISVLSGG